MPKFSIIVPVYNRVLDGKLRRCLDSVATQVFEDFECLVVDDGSKEDVAGLVAKYDERFRCLRIKHQGRVIARNVGMKAAKDGAWICHLDSDDCYDPMYLSTFVHFIDGNPEVHWWICGACVHGMIKGGGRHIAPKYTVLRKAWMPRLNPKATADNSEPKCLHFNSGHFGTGCYVFKKVCLDETGLLPNWINMYQVADGADEYLGYETGYSAAKKLCGNPWGEDWVLARALSMHFIPGLIEACLYVQYKR